MASESSEELAMSVELPPELVEWLDEEATAADVDRETLVAQLLASYQMMSYLSEDIEDETAVLDIDTVLEKVDETLQERIESTVVRSIESMEIASAGDEYRELSSRVDAVESDFQEKLTDVRKRVIQVKKETDKKAPLNHTHPEFDEVVAARADIGRLTETVEELQTDIEEQLSEQVGRTDEHVDRLDELQDRLQTVAWVVSDLRDEQKRSASLDALDRIKHAAAQADIERANCENCGEGVRIALMTEPRCPHCEATLTNVEPASGWFGKSRLTTPSQLESGENQ